MSITALGRALPLGSLFTCGGANVRYHLKAVVSQGQNWANLGTVLCHKETFRRGLSVRHSPIPYRVRLAIVDKAIVGQTSNRT